MSLILTLYSVISGGKVCIMALAQYAENGVFAPRRVAEAFRTSSEDVARTLGLGKDALQRRERIRSEKTQRRLREMLEVINKVEPRYKARQG